MGGVQGGWGIKGRKTWDNCNSITNKIYLEKSEPKGKNPTLDLCSHSCRKLLYYMYECIREMYFYIKKEK